MEEQPDKKSKCSQDDGSGGSCDGCNKDEKKSSGNTDPSSHQDVMANEILGGQNTSEGRSRDVDSISQRPKAPSDTKQRKYMGLCNQGSTCYLNSLLQCLFFTPELRRAICSCDNTDPGILHSLKKLFQELTDGKQIPTTTGITMCLGIRNVNQQQDIEEYFRQLMDKIIEEKEEIRQLYEVKQVHTITCCECRLQTKVENPVLSLSLSFKNLASNHAGYSVASALDEIQQENTFTGDDQLYCEKCRCKQDATSKYCFGSLPQILVLHLKRYQFDSFTGFTKLSCEVSVPLLLNMSKEDHTVVYYHLYAMCHHSGGIHGGHYLAEIKSFENNSWYEFNDSRVRKEFTGEHISKNSSCWKLMGRIPWEASLKGRGVQESWLYFKET